MRRCLINLNECRQRGVILFDYILKPRERHSKAYWLFISCASVVFASIFMAAVVISFMSLREIWGILSLLGIYVRDLLYEYEIIWLIPGKK